MIKLYFAANFNNRQLIIMDSTFYFNRDYKDLDSALVKSHLTFESVFGEPGHSILNYLFTTALYIPLFLMLAVPTGINIYANNIFHDTFFEEMIFIGFTLLFGAFSYFGVSGIWLFFQAKRKYSYLSKHGVVCSGYISSSRATFRTESGVIKRLRIVYCFMTPDGTILKGRQTKRIITSSKPDPGTPIAILYAGKRCHVVL